MTGSESSKRGELALRARNRARRAAATKPESLNEAVSNKMDEKLALMNAEANLKLPEGLLTSCGEVIQQDFRLPHIIDTLQNPNMISVIASEHRSTWRHVWAVGSQSPRWMRQNPFKLVIRWKKCFATRWQRPIEPQ